MHHKGATSDPSGSESTQFRAVQHCCLSQRIIRRSKHKILRANVVHCSLPSLIVSHSEAPSIVASSAHEQGERECRCRVCIGSAESILGSWFKRASHRRAAVSETQVGTPNPTAPETHSLHLDAVPSPRCLSLAIAWSNYLLSVATSSKCDPGTLAPPRPHSLILRWAVEPKIINSAQCNGHGTKPMPCNSRDCISSDHPPRRLSSAASLHESVDLASWQEEQARADRLGARKDGTKTTLGVTASWLGKAAGGGVGASALVRVCLALRLLSAHSTTHLQGTQSTHTKSRQLSCPIRAHIEALPSASSSVHPLGNQAGARPPPRGRRRDSLQEKAAFPAIARWLQPEMKKTDERPGCWGFSAMRTQPCSRASGQALLSCSSAEIRACPGLRSQGGCEPSGVRYSTSELLLRSSKAMPATHTSVGPIRERVSPSDIAGHLRRRAANRGNASIRWPPTRDGQDRQRGFVDVWSRHGARHGRMRKRRSQRGPALTSIDPAQRTTARDFLAAPHEADSSQTLTLPGDHNSRASQKPTHGNKGLAPGSAHKLDNGLIGKCGHELATRVHARMMCPHWLSPGAADKQFGAATRGGPASPSSGGESFSTRHLLDCLCPQPTEMAQCASAISAPAFDFSFPVRFFHRGPAADTRSDFLAPGLRGTSSDPVQFVGR
ncbi:hypothetical protein L1887_52994 [Cichorium endivia]|nr:hypothetical protein L1887_52994 [Cichorium endivia]